MGLCDLPSNQPWIVISTHLAALLPWSVLAFWDPIDHQWKPYRQVFFTSLVYFALTILPYSLLIPYCILQACSRKDPDLKELMTSLVLMLGSLWHLIRSGRGLLALHDIKKLWESIDFAERPLHLSLNLGESSLWDAQVSSALVDNDWPGDAPRVRYLRGLLSGKDERIDVGSRLCIEGIWSLWMQPYEYYFWQGDDLGIDRLLIASPESSPRNWMRKSFPVSLSWIPWGKQAVLERPSYISPFIVARLIRYVSGIKFYEEDTEYLWEAAFWKERMESSGRKWGFFPFRRRCKDVSLEKDLLGLSDLEQSDVDDQIAKLPRHGQKYLRGVPRYVVLDLSLHLRLNQLGYNSHLSRILLALGLPDRACRIIQNWLDSPISGETPKNRIQGRMLALIVILDNPRWVEFGTNAWTLKKYHDRLRTLHMVVHQWLHFRELESRSALQSTEDPQISGYPIGRKPNTQGRELLEDVLSFKSEKGLGKLSEKELEKKRETRDVIVRGALQLLKELINKELEDLRRVMHDNSSDGSQRNLRTGIFRPLLGSFSMLSGCVCGRQTSKKPLRPPLDIHLNPGLFESKRMGNTLTLNGNRAEDA